MSILIKGMEIPDCCTRCDYIGLNKAIGCDHYTNITRRADDCPIVEVPESHGRLIEADKVIDAIYERVKELQESRVFRAKHGDIDLIGVKPYISKIPTVIEEEK